MAFIPGQSLAVPTVLASLAVLSAIPGNSWQLWNVGSLASVSEDMKHDLPTATELADTAESHTLLEDTGTAAKILRYVTAVVLIGLELLIMPLVLRLVKRKLNRSQHHVRKAAVPNLCAVPTAQAHESNHDGNSEVVEGKSEVWIGRSQAEVHKHSAARHSLLSTEEEEEACLQMMQEDSEASMGSLHAAGVLETGRRSNELTSTSADVSTLPTECDKTWLRSRLTDSLTVDGNTTSGALEVAERTVGAEAHDPGQAVHVKQATRETKRTSKNWRLPRTCLSCLGGCSVAMESVGTARNNLVERHGKGICCVPVTCAAIAIGLVHALVDGVIHGIFAAAGEEPIEVTLNRGWLADSSLASIPEGEDRESIASSPASRFMSRSPAREYMMRSP